MRDDPRLNDPRLTALVFGELDESEAEALERELASDPELERDLRALLDTAGLLEEALSLEEAQSLEEALSTAALSTAAMSTASSPTAASLAPEPSSLQASPLAGEAGAGQREAAEPAHPRLVTELTVAPDAKAKERADRGGMITWWSFAAAAALVLAVVVGTASMGGEPSLDDPALDDPAPTLEDAVDSNAQGASTPSQPADTSSADPGRVGRSRGVDRQSAVETVAAPRPAPTPTPTRSPVVVRPASPRPRPSAGTEVLDPWSGSAHDLEAPGSYDFDDDRSPHEMVEADPAPEVDEPPEALPPAPEYDQADVIDAFSE